MQDAVAEVLHHREALANGRGLTLFLSAAAHVTLIAVAFVLAQRAEEEPRTRAIQIKLAGAPRSAPPAMRSETTPAPKPAVSAPKPVPVPLPEPPKAKPPKKSSEGASLFGRSELEAPHDVKPTPAPPTPPAASSVAGNLGAVPAVGKAGVTSLEGGPFPYNAYIDRMVTLVGGHWFRPQSGGDRVAQVYFVVERNGRVRDAKVERSSGDATFDRAAIRAIIETNPLPPLPLAYDGTYLGVHLTFH
jgi:protein TonB